MAEAPERGGDRAAVPLVGAGGVVALRLKMSEAGREQEGGLVPFVPSALAEAVAADWVLEFSCCCLCRHFVEECGSEFRRWRDVAQGEEPGLGYAVIVSIRRQSWLWRIFQL